MMNQFSDILLSELSQLALNQGHMTATTPDNPYIRDTIFNDSSMTKDAFIVPITPLSPALKKANKRTGLCLRDKENLA